MLLAFLASMIGIGGVFGEFDNNIAIILIAFGPLIFIGGTIEYAIKGLKTTEKEKTAPIPDVKVANADNARFVQKERNTKLSIKSEDIFFDPEVNLDAAAYQPEDKVETTSIEKEKVRSVKDGKIISADSSQKTGNLMHILFGPFEPDDVDINESAPAGDSNKKGIETFKQISFSNSEKALICTLGLTLLLLGILLIHAGTCRNDLGIGYYTFLRIATTVSFVWLAILIASPYWRFILGAGAVLFNPIIQIHLDKEVWLFFDVIAFILLIAASIYHYRKNIANTPAARR